MTEQKLAVTKIVLGVLIFLTIILSVFAIVVSLAPDNSKIVAFKDQSLIPVEYDPAANAWAAENCEIVSSHYEDVANVGVRCRFAL